MSRPASFFLFSFTLAVCVLATGCPPDLSGFVIVEAGTPDLAASGDDAGMRGDDAGTRGDQATPPLFDAPPANTDLHVPPSDGARAFDGGDGGPAFLPDLVLSPFDLPPVLPPDFSSVGSSCPTPWLLVATSDPFNNAGRIARFSLGNGLYFRCADLSGGGAIPAAITTVAYLPNGYVVVASIDQMVAIDPVKNTVVWTINLPENSGSSINLFPFVYNNKPVIGDAYSRSGTSIQVIHVFDPSTGAAAGADLVTNGNAGLGTGVFGFTPHPDAPNHLLALDTDHNVAALEFDPTTLTKTGLSISWTMNRLVSIYAEHAPGQPARIAWAAGTNGVYTMSNPANNGTFSAPLSCPTYNCTYVFAVPDPMNAAGVLAMCDVSGSARRVLRYDAASCLSIYDTVIQGSFFPQNLAVRLQ